MTGCPDPETIRDVDEAAYRGAEQRLWAAIDARPTERWLDLRRTGARVRVQLVGDGPDAVFVHGANTSGLSWATLAGRLPGFRSTLVDRPGTGLSPRLATPLDATTLPAFADALIVDVLDALALERSHVVATSLGGFVGLRTAAAHPGRVQRMVQFSWPVGAPTEHLPAFLRVASIPGVGRLMAALPVSERSVRAIFRRVGHGPSLASGRITQADLDAYVALLRHTDTLRNEVGPARAFVSALHGLDALLLPDDVLAAIRAPTRFIWGGRDPFGGLATARALVARIPGAELEILPDAGHAPWLDDLDRCVALVAEFLGRPA
jgi:pimeloyl-ACP methyl ester carboxylesterase